MGNTRLRLTAVALFLEGDAILLLHQITPPEPDCWDLPGGGLRPEEDLMTRLYQVRLIDHTMDPEWDRVIGL
jgi:ADP-ribose pyrophosphatase YjhB (NUDIX family)